MPVYHWKCEGCEEMKEIIRPHSEYDRPPEESCKNCEETRWKKTIPSPPQTMKGPNWGAGKGNWLILFCLLGLSFWTKPVSAQYKSALQVEELSFESYKVGTFRDANFPDSEEKNTKGVAFNIDLSVFKYFKWENRVWTHGNDAKLYTVGWEYNTALQLHKHLDLFHYHHSQHSMDEPTAAHRFPNRNYYGVRFNFIPK